MKRTKNWITALLVLVMVSAGTETFAQRFNQGERPGRGQRQWEERERGARAMEMLDLTEEQAAQLKEMRGTHQKDMTYAMNQIREKEAHLQTLLSAPEQDQKAINKTIDDIAAARAEQMKKKIANRNDLKKILSEEQISQMENLRGHRGPQQGFGPGREMGRGPGAGRGQRCAMKN